MTDRSPVYPPADSQTSSPLSAPSPNYSTNKTSFQEVLQATDPNTSSFEQTGPNAFQMDPPKDAHQNTSSRCPSKKAPEQMPVDDPSIGRFQNEQLLPGSALPLQHIEWVVNHIMVVVKEIPQMTQTYTSQPFLYQGDTIQVDLSKQDQGLSLKLTLTKKLKGLIEPIKHELIQYLKEKEFDIDTIYLEDFEPSHQPSQEDSSDTPQRNHDESSDDNSADHDNSPITSSHFKNIANPFDLLL